MNDKDVMSLPPSDALGRLAFWLEAGEDILRDKKHNEELEALYNRAHVLLDMMYETTEKIVELENK